MSPKMRDLFCFVIAALAQADASQTQGSPPKASDVDIKFLEERINEGGGVRELSCAEQKKKTIGGLNAIPSTGYPWDKGLFVQIDPAFSNDENKLIQDALSEVNKHFCKGVRVFGPKEQPSGDYVRIVRGLNNTGCTSPIGRQGTGMQKVNFEVGVCFWKYVVIHEIFHSLGFVHEQCRPDRDEYIEILWENVKKGHKGNFKIYEGYDSYGIPYDYKSIMHYSSTSSTKDKITPLYTMLKLDGSVIPYNEELTQSDIKKLRRMYKC